MFIIDFFRYAFTYYCRTSRGKFWLTAISMYLIIMGLMIAAALTKFAEQYILMAVFVTLLALIYYIPMIAITIRRLHDTGKSAIMLLYPLICALIMLMAALIKDYYAKGLMEIIGLSVGFVGMILNMRVFFRLFHRTEEDSEWAFTPQV